jgi:TPP-dependent 2-oxoacid decarboxylase
MAAVGSTADLEPASASIGGFHYPRVALRDVLTRLGTQVSGRKPARRAARPPAGAAPFEPKPATAITADRFWEAFSSFAEQDDVLTVDPGVNAAVLKFFTRLPVRTRMVTQETWMAIGWALAAGLGAQLADRSHRHILVMGDGAFQETAQELSTILRHGLAPVILVFNNSRYQIENWNHAGAGIPRRPGEPIPSISDTTSCRAGTTTSSPPCSPRRRNRWAFASPQKRSSARPSLPRHRPSTTGDAL